MPTDSILDALKAQTHSLHEQLEAHVDILNRLKSMESYQRLLGAFYGFYTPIENQLVQCQELKSAGLDMEPRRKVPLLVADLQFLNVTVDTLPLAREVPQIASAAQAFGCLYVLEGATLGSQIIKRLLLQHRRISAENGGEFFNAYGENVGSMWNMFRDAVSQFSVTHPQQHAVIIATARDTFTMLDVWFRRCLD